MNKNSTVTVLMPVYNAEEYIKEAVTSILNQSYTDLILLIINDGSTDKSVDLIEKFNDSRIFLVHNKENKGIVYSLNKGIHLAETDFIARMDADDIAHPLRLEKQVQFLNNNTDTILVGSYFKFINGDIVTYPVEHHKIKAKLLVSNTFCHSSVLFRKQPLVLNGIEYDLSYQTAEDYKLWTDIVQIGRVSNIPEPLIYYRTHLNQISTKQRQIQKDLSRRIRKEYLTSITNANLHHEEIFMLMMEGTKFHNMELVKLKDDFDEIWTHCDDVEFKKIIETQLYSYIKNHSLSTESINLFLKYLNSWHILKLKFKVLK